jgi:hypothetical protein
MASKQKHRGIFTRIGRTIRAALPGRREIREDFEMAAEQIDPAQADLRVVMPEEGAVEATEGTESREN